MGTSRVREMQYFGNTNSFCGWVGNSAACLDPYLSDKRTKAETSCVLSHYDVFSSRTKLRGQRKSQCSLQEMVASCVDGCACSSHTSSRNVPRSTEILQNQYESVRKQSYIYSTLVSHATNVQSTYGTVSTKHKWRNDLSVVPVFESQSSQDTTSPYWHFMHKAPLFSLFPGPKLLSSLSRRRY
jgi:hypothetical protein